MKLDEKINEIKAIPKLLDLLFLEGCTLSIDAMECQTDIASKIIEKQADYILAVKGNQGNIEQAIADTVLFEKPETFSVQEDVGNGRIESRTCYAYSELGHIGDHDYVGDGQLQKNK